MSLPAVPGAVASSMAEMGAGDICAIAANSPKALAAHCAVVVTGEQNSDKRRLAAAHAALGRYWQFRGDPAKAEFSYLRSFELYVSDCSSIWSENGWVADPGYVYQMLHHFYGFDAAGTETRCAYEFGRAFNLDREHVDAVKFFTRAIETGVRLFDAYYYRGIEHFRIGDFDRSFADLDRAVALDGNSAAAFATRGHFHLIMNHRAAAERDLLQALAIDPNMEQAATQLEYLRTVKGR